jgi:hypothetical protein
MTGRSQPAHSRDRVLPRPAAALLAALLALPAAALACSPPRPFDLSLTLTATVDGGGAIAPGARGRLVFTAWEARGRRGPESFSVRQGSVEQQAQPPIRLTAAPGADCTVEDRLDTGNGLLARYQIVLAPRDRHAFWPRACHVDYEVLPAADAWTSMRYTVMPSDPCGMDINLANNHADLVFGTIPPPAAPPQPVPLAAWPLLLLVLAMLAAARAARPAHAPARRRA